MKKVLCFYHGADLDGKCSGAIVKYIFHDAIMIPVDYDKKVDWSLIDKDTMVILTDFSFPKDDMIQLKKEAGNFIWIDHHISIINKLYGIAFEGLRVDGVAACVLTWQFFMGEDVPLIVKMLGDYDVWDLSPSVLSVQYGMRQYDCDPSNQGFWKSIFEKHNSLIHEITSKGETILNYVTKSNKIEINGIGFITKFRSYRILAANRSHISSLFFEDHFEANNVDIVMPFSWNGKSWKISMYTKLSEVDVSKICSEFGGGGHKKAAGFTTKELPEEFQKVIFGE